MEKESFIIKVLTFWSKLWSKITWLEVIIISILAFAFMMYIKLNVAHFYVECDDGSVVEINEFTTEVCGQAVQFNKALGKLEVIKKNGFMDYNFNNFSSSYLDNLSVER